MYWQRRQCGKPTSQCAAPLALLTEAPHPMPHPLERELFARMQTSYILWLNICLGLGQEVGGKGERLIVARELCAS